MKKKGQLTIFIILGVFILLVTIGLFFLIGSESKEQIGSEEFLPLEVGSIKFFVDSCLMKTVREGVVEISRNGGYYHFDNNNNNISNFHLKAYYYYEGEVLVPSLETIENELEIYIEEKLPYCTNWFESLPEFDVLTSYLEADVTILPEKVMVNINYPLEIKQGNITTEISEFKYELSARLGKIHAFLENYFTEWQVNYPQGIVLSPFDKFSEDGFYYYFVDTYAPYFIFLLMDNDVDVDYLPFYFEFAVRYELVEVEPWEE